MWVILATSGLFVTTTILLGQEVAVGVLLLLAVPILFILAVLLKLGDFGARATGWLWNYFSNL